MRRQIRDLHLGITPWRRRDGGEGSSFVAQARLAERLGYGSFWLPERHFAEEGIPSPLLELAAVAAATSTLRLGTTSYLLPIRQPLLAAEEVATLDRLSGGRLILGLGRGFRRGLFEVFEVPRSEKRTRFEEALGRMIAGWSGTALDSRGELRLLPAPVQRPHPPLWVAAFGPKALTQAGRLGLPYLASPLETVEQLEANARIHTAALPETARGRLPVPVMRSVLVTEDALLAEKAREAAVGEARGFGRLLGSDAGESNGGHAIIGDREQVAGEIERYRERLGMTHLITRPGVAGLSPEAVEASIRALTVLFDVGAADETAADEARVDEEAGQDER